MLISSENVYFGFCGGSLLENVCFTLSESERVGLIGGNGEGKTTLIRLILGELDPESGGLFRKNAMKIGYLAQNGGYDSDNTVYEEMREIFAEDIRAIETLREVENAISKTQEDTQEYRALTSKYEWLNKQIAARDSYQFDVKIRTVLGGMGFESAYEQKISTMSGGEKTRLKLCRLLLESPDLLILDEPTNHLDMKTLFWLEDYLSTFKGAILTVSHDRYFLDRVCNEIIEIDNKRFYRYKGNYSYYLEKRQERIDQTNAELARANNLFRKELDWMRRQPQARATKAKSRIEDFYKLQEKVSQKVDNGKVRLENKSTYIGSKIFEAKYISKSFGDLKILDNFYYQFSRYEKMGIIGANGTGKSTFIKLLLGVEKPDAGSFDIGETVRFGYYSQEGLKFNDQMKVIDAVREIAEEVDLGGGRKLSASQFLQHFLFAPETQHNYIYKLSGGEKRRLYLCTVLMRNPNFLVLDEPTNDLDIVTLNILEDYLINFKGCVIVVSHDRYFMDKVVDHLLVFKGNAEIKDFPGNYTDYRDWRNEQEAIARKASAAENTANAMKIEALTSLDASQFVTVSLVMTLSIMVGIWLVPVLCKKMQSGMINLEKRDKKCRSSWKIQSPIKQKTLCNSHRSHLRLLQR